MAHRCSIFPRDEMGIVPHIFALNYHMLLHTLQRLYIYLIQILRIHIYIHIYIRRYLLQFISQLFSLFLSLESGSKIYVAIDHSLGIVNILCEAQNRVSYILS